MNTRLSPETNVRQRRNPRMSKAMETFQRQLQEILNAYHCPHLLYLVPPEQLQSLLESRPSHAIIVKGKNCEMPEREFRRLQGQLSKKLSETKVSLVPNGQPVSLVQFYTLAPSLMQLQRLCRITEFRNAREIEQVLNDKFNFRKAPEDARHQLSKLCAYTALIRSSLNKKLVAIDPRVENGLSDPSFRGLKIVVHSCPIQIRNFTIDRITRPAYRIGYACRNGQPAWLDLDLSLFGNTPCADQVKLPVYIQAHTIHRLRQRLDIIDYNSFYLQLILSLKSPKVMRYKNRNLIGFFLFGQKAGYLLTQHIKENLLIKTFLLLSDNGTPEGDRARELCELFQIDLHQWDTDRLSTFYHSSLKLEEKTKLIISHAGCKSLFDIQPRVPKPWPGDDKNAAYLLKLMKADQPPAREIGSPQPLKPRQGRKVCPGSS